MSAESHRAKALEIAAIRRSGLAEIYSEDIPRNVIRDAEIYLRWIGTGKREW